jgi:aspartyl-tRNA(Asn)/glutamyl-tRNA(Gln) amidotransferase subunit A
VFPLSRTCDHVGTLTRTVAQTATLLGVLAGRRYQLRPVAGLRVGVLRRQLDDPDVVPAVRERVTDAIERIAAAGIEVHDVDLPELELVDEALGTIILREAWEVHRGLFERDAAGYGPGTRALLELGSQVEGEAYRAGLADRDRVRAAFAALFEQVDVLVGPTVAYAAPAEDPPVGTPEGDLEGRFTGPYNLVGNPAVSMPCGPIEGDLPAGLQLAAAVGDDELLLSVAKLYEEVSA